MAKLNSGTRVHGAATVDPDFRIGADTLDGVGVGGERLNGKIYNQLVYNRALTAAEIVQNYNAARSRHGI